MQNMTPLGGARGTDEVTGLGRGPVLETGTCSDECRILNELEVGPKGKKGVVWVSEPMTQVPSGLWVVVTTLGAARTLDAIASNE